MRTPEIDEMSTRLGQCLAKKRRILAVVGSGLSQAAGFPLLLGSPGNPGIVDLLCVVLRQELAEQAGIDPWATLFHEAARGNRSAVERLFGFLELDDEAARRSRARLDRWLQGKECPDNFDRVNVYELDEARAPAYAALAKLIATYPGQVAVLTTNYDGLLEKAIARVTRAAGTQGSTAIGYNSAEGLAGWHKSGRPIAPIIRVRGDILRGMCSGGGSECTEAAREFFVPENVPPYCPSCGAPIQLVISFPGQAMKEERNRSLLETVSDLILPTVGAVLLTGFSGDWDEDVSELLCRASGTIPICEVNRTKSFVCQMVEASEGSALGKKNYLISGKGIDAHEVLPSLIDSALEAARSIAGRPRVHNEATRSVPGGDIYDADLYIYGAEIVAQSTEAFRRLENLRQIGLESFYFGADHTRAQHSYGAMHAAEFLYDAYLGQRGDEGEKRLLRLAALLHDVGHVPFTHVAEEVLEELGWDAPVTGEVFRHAYFAEELLLGDSEFVSKTDELLHPYDARDLCRLIRGSLGIPYLDCIISSSFDADRIDYVLRDGRRLRQYIGIEPISWSQIQTKLTGPQRIAHLDNGHVVLHEEAAALVVDLLAFRQRLYERVYFSPRGRFGECAAKMLLVPYFLRLAAESSLFGKTADDLLNASSGSMLPFPSGDYEPEKIRAVLRSLRRVALDNPDLKSNPEEKWLLQKAMESLRTADKTVARSFRIALEGGQKDVSPLVTRTFRNSPVGDTTMLRILHGMRKEISQRFPWVLVIDVHKIPGAFSPTKYRVGNGLGSNIEDFMFVKTISGETISLSEYLVRKLHVSDEEKAGLIRIQAFALSEDQSLVAQARRSLELELQRFPKEEYSHDV